MTVHLLQICQDTRTGDNVVAQPSVEKHLQNEEGEREFKVAKVHKPHVLQGKKIS